LNFHVRLQREPVVGTVQSVSELTSHFGVPTVLAQKKDLAYVDEHARAFIARSPFLVMSTADADGWPDASPRGDAPGFVAVEGSRTLLMPERPGNNRVDSFHNLMANPKVGLLFFVPGHPHSLRVNGTARLLTDAELRARFAVQGKPARAVLDVTAHQVFFHCGKSLIRSRLWEPAQWPDRTGLAGLGAALADQIKTIDTATAEAMVAESIAKRLY
jgi:PPOX class probable FMN-dependent enzyme